MVSYKALNILKKGFVPNISHTIWNIDAGERFTPVKIQNSKFKTQFR